MGVPKVVVVAAGGLVPLMMERAFLVLYTVSRGAGRYGLVAFVRAQVVLLSQLPRQRVVVRESRRVTRMVFRRSVL